MNIQMNHDIMNKLIFEINRMVKDELNIMEVCGTHTQVIAKLGLKSILTPKINLISGPGCPICVTEESYIDYAVALLEIHHVTIVTFGDLMRVKGTKGSLIDMKSKGFDVRVVYSPLELIELAEHHPQKIFVFLAVGFETTAPLIALIIKNAKLKNIQNLLFLTSIKQMEPILHYILKQKQHSLHGLICPGHVATIKGAHYFEFIKEYHIPAAICGFEAIDVIGGIYYLVKQITTSNTKAYENLYKHCVSYEGNIKANQLIDDVFEHTTGIWRGIGDISHSALSINELYSDFDALKRFQVQVPSTKINTLCECKEIILGNKAPHECKLFSKTCHPSHPMGPCMVSLEGACLNSYRYKEE